MRIGSPIFPIQASRQIYAEHLCNVIFDYLATHEMAHIVNGHASYTAFEFAVPCMMEFGSIPARTEASMKKARISTRVARLRRT